MTSDKDTLRPLRRFKNMNRTHFLALAVVILGLGIGMLIMQDAMTPAERGKDYALRQQEAKEITAVPQRDKNLGKRAPRVERDLLEELISIKGEHLVRFESEKAYRDALASLGDSGAKLLGKLDRFRTLRLSTYDLERLKNWIGEEGQQFSNYLVSLPLIPDTDKEFAAGASFGRGALEFLGITGDNSSWGEGVKIAVVDTAVQSHLSLDPDKVSTINLESAPAVSEVHGHGTAVASIISGSHDSLTGVAPSAEIISVPVADGSGNSNSFLLAEGIFAAVEYGVDIINVSMGSYGDSIIVQEAVRYAQENGIAIVASVGNEGFDQAAFPAGNEGVISVGSVDAMGLHMGFSNESANLSTTAPGVGVLAAWPGDNAISFTGSSASAPFVSGTLAAIISESNSSLTGMQAWEIAQHYTNEAGAPGADSQYGIGIINAGRATQRDIPGIYDIAVAQPYFDFEDNTLQITVENRGTEVLNGSQLNIGASGGSYPLTVQSLGVNERQLFEIPMGPSDFSQDGTLSVSSQSTLNSSLTDALPANNQRNDVITAPLPANGP